jgi:hypothetical protein
LGIFLARSLEFGASIRTVRYKINLLLGLLTFLFPICEGFAGNPLAPSQSISGEFAEEVQRLIDAEHYEEALMLFAELPLEKQLIPSVQMNIGLLEKLRGDEWMALYSFERAQVNILYDPALQEMIRLTRRRLARQQGFSTLPDASNWAESLGDQMPYDSLHFLTISVLLGVLLLWGFGFKKTRRLKSILFYPQGLIALIGLALMGVLWSIKVWSDYRPAALVNQAFIVRSGPGEEFLEIQQIPQGSKVRINHRYEQRLLKPDDWYQVKISSEQLGWLPGSSLLLLTMR